MKACDTNQLERIIQKAAKSVNRTLGLRVLALLDEDGVHVLQPVMMHEYSRMSAIRCKAFIALKQNEEPVEMFLDVPADEYNSLTDAQALLANLIAAQMNPS